MNENIYSMEIINDIQNPGSEYMHICGNKAGYE